MAKDKNILLDSPEEQISTGSLGTLLDAEEIQSAQGQQAGELDTIFAQIQELYEKGDLTQVLALVEEAMKLDPSNGNLVLLMGLVNRDMGKKIQAVHWLRKALNDFGMTEAEPELMKLYQSGVAGADAKKKAEAYFAGTDAAAVAKPEEKKTASAVEGKKSSVADVEEAFVKKSEPKAEAKAEVKPEAKKETKKEKEKDLCSYPALGTPLYTVEEYREFLTKHPNMSEDQRLKLAEEQGRGFGYLYMSTAEKQVRLNDNNYWRPWNEIMQHASTSSDAKKTVSTWKDVHSFARQGIVSILNDYVEKCGRKIDCWPTSETGSGFSIFTSQGRVDGKYQRPFSFFSDDYGMALNNGRITINDKAVRTYNHPYKLQPKELKKPDALVKLEKEIETLKKTPTYTSGDIFKHKMSMVASIALFLILGIPVVLLLLAQMGMFGGFEGVDAMVEAFKLPGAGSVKAIRILSGILTAIPFILWKIMMIISEIAGMLSSVVGWIVTIFQVLFVGAFALASLGYPLSRSSHATKKKQIEGAQAQKRALELENSEELKHLKEEYKVASDKYTKDFTELSEQWQRKWYYATERTDS